MKISVLQWNIWYQEDIANIASFIKANKADVICLQELTLNYVGQTVIDTPKYIAEQLGYNYYCKELPIESTDGVTMMLANGIFSRFSITNKRYAWINQPKDGGGYSDEYRAYVEVELDVEGDKVWIGTTHMSYTHGFEDTPQKKQETDLLLSELAKHETKFIFMGDLNAPQGSYTINSIDKLIENTGPDTQQKTWTTKPFSYNGFEETELNWRLDYVYKTRDIKTTSAKILATDYSDHLPVFAELSF